MKTQLPVFLLILSLFSCTTATPSPIPALQPTSPAKPQTSRGDYKDLGIPSTFKKLYDDAKAKNESWVTKVDEVAMQAAGKSSESGKVSVYFSAQENAIAIITSGNLEDDSVKQIEKWIELTKKGNAWEVDWIGARFMCRRGNNATLWQKEFCP